MSSLSDMINSVRLQVDDAANNKNVLREDLSVQMATGNKTFMLSKRNIVTASDVVIVDGAALVNGVGYTLVNATGVITLVAAPTASIYVTYFWQDFTDTDITDFIVSGLEHIGYSSLGTSSATTDMLAVPQGLLPACEHFADYHAYSSLATKTARLYQAGAGKKNVNKDSISAKYRELAKQFHEDAIVEMNAFYERQGRRNAPAYGASTTVYPTNTPRR